jgi:uncharacterized membrane protein
MLIWDVVLLYRYFPQSEEKPFAFLAWVDEFLPLAFTGLFVNLGLFSHLVIMWMGPLQVHVQGLFYGAPYHDGIFKYSDHHYKFCGIHGSKFLPQIQELLQSVQ